MKVVHPILKSLHSPDVYDLKNFTPDDAHCFGFLLQAMFGPNNSEGQESFDIIVCTPKWIEDELENKKIINGAYHIIVSSYDYDEIVLFLERFGARCKASTWHEAALKLSQVGKWEFQE